MLWVPCSDPPYTFCRLLQVLLLNDSHCHCLWRSALERWEPLRTMRCHKNYVNTYPIHTQSNLESMTDTKTSSLPQGGTDFGKICLLELPLGLGQERLHLKSPFYVAFPFPCPVFLRPLQVSPESPPSINHLHPCLRLCF